MEEAIERVMNKVDDEIDPEKMDPSEAIEFLETLAGELEIRVMGLREDMDMM